MYVQPVRVSVYDQSHQKWLKKFGLNFIYFPRKRTITHMVLGRRKILSKSGIATPMSIPATKFGIVTQCLSPQKNNDHYLTNDLVKINVKLGGLDP